MQSVFISFNVGRGSEKYCDMITFHCAYVTGVQDVCLLFVSPVESALKYFSAPSLWQLCAECVHVFGEGSECVDGEVHTTSLSLSAANPQTVRDTASATGGTADCRYLILKLESALKLLILD